MRKRMRLGLVMAVLAAIALAVSACGGDDSDSGSGDSGSGGGDAVELTVWHMEQPPNRVDQWNRLIERFNREHPDISVKAEVQAWDQVYSKIAGAAQSDTAPDVLFTIPDFTTYVKQMGIVQPVNDIVDRIEARHGYIPAAVAPYRSGEEILAVPLYGMVQMLWYRRDLFRRAGLQEPRTWSELEAAARALTTGDQHGIALPAGRNLATDQVVYSLMITNRAENFYAGEGDEIDFDTPETVASFELYDRLLEFSPRDSGNYSWGEPQAALNNGSAAMAIEKGQFLGPFTRESGRPAADLGCAFIPQPDSGGQPGSIYYSNGAMLLSDNEAKREAAATFLEWLVDPEVYGEFLNAEPGLFLPLTRDGRDARGWLDNPVVAEHRDCVEKMLQQSDSGQLFGFNGGEYHDSIGDISGQNILAQVVQRMYVDGDSPADAVAWGQGAMEEAVAR